jgi:hypothetical protein
MQNVVTSSCEVTASPHIRNASEQARLEQSKMPAAELAQEPQLPAPRRTSEQARLEQDKMPAAELALEPQLPA